MTRGNDRKSAVKRLKNLVYNGKSDAETFRKKLNGTFTETFLPNNVEFEETSYGNIKCDVLSPEIYASNRVMLYIHGGSFVGGSRAAYRAFCSSLASKCFCRVVIPEYRLAPSYPFPAANEDIQNVFKSLFTEEQVACALNSDKGSKSVLPEFIIAADGSAASILCSLIFNLRDRYRFCVKNVILFSPWLDISPDSRCMTTKKIKDDVLSSDSFKKSSAVYTYESNTVNPFISPLKANDEQLKNFPPLTIQLGSREFLLKDAEDFTKRMTALGNKCTLDVWQDMIFMFQMADQYFYESHLALDKIGKIVTGEDKKSEAVKYQNMPKLEYSLNSEA